MILRSGFVLLLSLAAVSCGNAPPRVAGKPVTIDVPLGLPAVPVPPDNPPTEESIALGKKLFFDTRLSADNTVSCASCHDPRHNFTDGMPTAKGIRNQFGRRNSPTVVNAAYAPLLFLDGRAASLEEQAGGPIANPIEMGETHATVSAKLERIPEYKEAFERAFGPGSVTIGKIEMAVASYERTVLSGDSPFDRFLYKDDKSALSEAAQRGMKIFVDKKRGNCSTCHTIGETYALFSDGKFHNIGAGIDTKGQMTDLGRYEQTKAEADKGAFRTPSLRNVALTAPYMHDGSLKTLKDVVDFYAGGGTSNPQLDPEIHELKLSGQDRADLVAFLESLTGEPPMNADEHR